MGGSLCVMFVFVEAEKGKLTSDLNCLDKQLGCNL